jgi:hypothetical protein
LSKSFFVDLCNFGWWECLRDRGQRATVKSCLDCRCGSDKILELEKWVEDKTIEDSLVEREGPRDRADRAAGIGPTMLL